jgi:hypothetical protein
LGVSLLPHARRIQRMTFWGHKAEAGPFQPVDCSLMLLGLGHSANSLDEERRCTVF